MFPFNSQSFCYDIHTLFFIDNQIVPLRTRLLPSAYMHVQKFPDHSELLGRPVGFMSSMVRILCRHMR